MVYVQCVKGVLCYMWFVEVRGFRRCGVCVMRGLVWYLVLRALAAPVAGALVTVLKGTWQPHVQQCQLQPLRPAVRVCAHREVSGAPLA